MRRLAPLRRVQLAPKPRGRLPTRLRVAASAWQAKPRGPMDVRVVSWMTARYYSLRLKRALSGGDIRPAVCQPYVHGTRPRAFPSRVAPAARAAEANGEAFDAAAELDSLSIWNPIEQLHGTAAYRNRRCRACPVISLRTPISTRR